MHIVDKNGLLFPPTMFTRSIFTAPQDAASRLKTLPEGSLLSFLQQLPWSFLQSLINSLADFDSLDLFLSVLKALPSNFDDVFNEVTEEGNDAQRN